MVINFPSIQFNQTRNKKGKQKWTYSRTMRSITMPVTQLTSLDRFPTSLWTRKKPIHVYQLIGHDVKFKNALHTYDVASPYRLHATRPDRDRPTEKALTSILSDLHRDFDFNFSRETFFRDRRGCNLFVIYWIFSNGFARNEESCGSISSNKDGMDRRENGFFWYVVVGCQICRCSCTVFQLKVVLSIHVVDFGWSVCTVV